MVETVQATSAAKQANQKSVVAGVQASATGKKKIAETFGERGGDIHCGDCLVS